MSFYFYIPILCMLFHYAAQKTSLQSPEAIKVIAFAWFHWEYKNKYTHTSTSWLWFYCVCVWEMAKFSIYTIGNGKITSFELKIEKFLVCGSCKCQNCEWHLMYTTIAIIKFSYSRIQAGTLQQPNSQAKAFGSLQFCSVLFNEWTSWMGYCVCCEKSLGKRTTQKPYTHNEMNSTKNAKSRIRTENFLENCVYFNVFLVDCWWALNPRSQRVVVLK